MPRRLLIQASSSHKGRRSIVPINTGEFISLVSNLGNFSVSINIKNFDGCINHKDNSLYNVRGEEEGESVGRAKTPNLRIFVKFTPLIDIEGSQLLFGNDCEVPINDKVPTSLISTGLHFFKWFVNPTINSNLYVSAPYLYGLALNSFTKIGNDSLIDADGFLLEDTERLSKSDDVPPVPAERQKYFCNVKNCENFQFGKNQTYFFVFDTNLINIGDSSYNVSIPTFREKTIDIDVQKYSDEKLNNFNWTIKKGGVNGTYYGEFGLVVNFALVNEGE